MNERDSVRGISAVPGIVKGTVCFLSDDMDLLLKTYRKESAEREKEKFFQSRKDSLAAGERIVKDLRKENSEEQAAILEARGMILSDTVLESETIHRIEEEDMSAPLAVLKASEGLAEQFSDLDDPYLRERASDIQGAGKEIALRLLGQDTAARDVQGPVILCGQEIDPAVVADAERGGIAGLVIGSASRTSHAVIIAKSRGIPTVVGIEALREKIPDRAPAILDGNEGVVLVNPDEAAAETYRRKIEEEAALNRYYAGLAEKPAVTGDGFRVTLAANIGKPHDLDGAEAFGYEGVGLFRTEFLFMGRETFPTEEEQFEAYRYAVEKCGGKLCVIRTMDIGGDKPLSYLQIPEEKNPFLGWRAIRISLERTDLFLPQVRAILRAGVYGRAAVMLPMISGVEEIRKARGLIRQAMDDLKREGIPFSADIPVGIMVETPAAAVMARQLAPECDFFSIGTNDLVQYTLAVDRGNAKISSLYSYFHPAVLSLIAQVAQAAKERGIWVGMCGEMAGDPRAARFLCSLGFDELSMSPPSIPKVKDAVRRLETSRSEVEKVLSLGSVTEAEAYFAAPSGEVRSPSPEAPKKRP